MYDCKTEHGDCTVTCTGVDWVRGYGYGQPGATLLLGDSKTPQPLQGEYIVLSRPGPEIQPVGSRRRGP
jgi:hypothetical protein